MATVADTISNASGTAIASCPIDFFLMSAPVDDLGDFVSGKIVRAVTGTGGSAGQFSITLRSGTYRVRTPGTPEFFILVPFGSGTYTISAILISETEADAVIGYFETVAEAQANRKTYNLIWIRETSENEDYGWFEAKGDSGTHDGENYIVNAEGVVYTRRQ